MRLPKPQYNESKQPNETPKVGYRAQSGANPCLLDSFNAKKKRAIVQNYMKTPRRTERVRLETKFSLKKMESWKLAVLLVVWNGTSQLEKEGHNTIDWNKSLGIV
eukprot:5805289-Amphidinium_carterae.1